MRRIAALAHELWGLFVDDGGMAGAILGWLALVGVFASPGAPLGAVLPAWRGPLLLAGLGLLFSWACLRAARRLSRERG